MSKSKERDTSTAVAEDPASLPMHTVGLQSALGKHVQRLLAPYVRHQLPCTGEPDCSCGLSTALSELARTEVMALRYGA